MFEVQRRPLAQLPHSLGPCPKRRAGWAALSEAKPRMRMSHESFRRLRSCCGKCCSVCGLRGETTLAALEIHKNASDVLLGR